MTAPWFSVSASTNIVSPLNVSETKQIATQRTAGSEARRTLHLPQSSPCSGPVHGSSRSSKISLKPSFHAFERTAHVATQGQLATSAQIILPAVQQQADAGRM